MKLEEGGGGHRSLWALEIHERINIFLKNSPRERGNSAAVLWTYGGRTGNANDKGRT